MKVFISSTYEDLQELRRLAMGYLSQFPVDIEGMEVWGSSNDEPLERCLEKGRESDVYLGIIGHRYGCVDEDLGKSITELEYLEAEKKGIDRLMFVMSDNYAIEPIFVDKGSNYELLKVFKGRIFDLHYVSKFNNDVEFMEKLNLTFREYLESQGYEDELVNLASVWSSITDSLGDSRYPDELRMRLDNMRNPVDVFDEFKSEIDGIESAHTYIQNSYNTQYDDLLKVLAEFNITKDDLDSKFNYYDNPFSGRDWEMITLFPNRVMNLRKTMYSLQLGFLLQRAMQNPWSKELYEEIKSVKSMFKAFVQNNGYID